MANPKVILSVAGNNQPIVTSTGEFVPDSSYNYTLLSGATISAATYVQSGIIDLVNGSGTIIVTADLTLVTAAPVILILQVPGSGEKMASFELVISEVS